MFVYLVSNFHFVAKVKSKSSFLMESNGISIQNKFNLLLHKFCSPSSYIPFNLCSSSRYCILLETILSLDTLPVNRAVFFSRSCRELIFQLLHAPCAQFFLQQPKTCIHHAKTNIANPSCQNSICARNVASSRKHNAVGLTFRQERHKRLWNCVRRPDIFSRCMLCCMYV